MVDHTATSNNVVDVNNVADHNTDVNNAGPVGLNVDNNINADNNNSYTSDILGPSEYRDRLTASSSSLSRRLEEDRRRPLQSYQSPAFQEVPLFAGADATTRALFAAINQTNYLIFSQGERLRALEDSRRAPKRHRRPHSPPPRQIEYRPQSLPRRRRRDASRSSSPQLIGRRPVDTGRRDHIPRVKRKDPLKTETGEMMNAHTARGILCATRAATATVITTGHLLDLRTEVTKTPLRSSISSYYGGTHPPGYGETCPSEGVRRHCRLSRPYRWVRGNAALS